MLSHRVRVSGRFLADARRELAMRRRFVTLDVFTDRRITGNPLAVVLDAEGLDGAVM